MNPNYQQGIYHVNVNVDLMKENVIQINGERITNVNVSVRNVMNVKTINSAICNCENGKYLASIMDYSAITCHEVIESYDQDANAQLYVKKSSNEEKAACQLQIFIFYSQFFKLL